MQGSGFRVQDLGWRVAPDLCLGVRVWGLEFRVYLGFRVHGLGFIVQGLGLRVMGLGFRV